MELSPHDLVAVVTDLMKYRRHPHHTALLRDFSREIKIPFSSLWHGKCRLRVTACEAENSFMDCVHVALSSIDVCVDVSQLP